MLCLKIACGFLFCSIACISFVGPPVQHAKINYLTSFLGDLYILSLNSQLTISVVLQLFFLHCHVKNKELTIG